MMWLTMNGAKIISVVMLFLSKMVVFLVGYLKTVLVRASLISVFCLKTSF